MGDFFYTDGLAVGYNKKALIENIGLHVRRGEILTLIGPNGSGKSTILKTIIRQLRPLGGTVWFDGRDLAHMDGLETAKRLSALMTDRIRPELMTCREVVSMGRYPYTGRLGILTDKDREKVAESLELVRGTNLAEQNFMTLSDGQRQRILLARALCQEPELLVLDEPTSFLDIRYKLELLGILKEMARTRRIAVVMSLHELDLAQRVSDYAVCIHNNAVERCGPPEEIFTPDYILRLYGADSGSYNAAFGCVELASVPGPPEAFVIGGGGGGIPVYRRLQRKGIPFAAGVLHENDVEFLTAQSLASAVVSERAFEPVSPEALKQAEALMGRCKTVYCCVKQFGSMNEKNRLLAELAQKAGTLKPLDG